MPKYEVIITGDATVSQLAVVSARNQFEACQQALEEVDNSKWVWDDCNTPQDIYTTGCEKIESSTRCKTRADLRAYRPAWHNILTTDGAGNPCVWRNYYVDEEGRSWTDEWSCQCYDDDIEPYSSEWIGPEDEAEVALWESLPDAK